MLMDADLIDGDAHYLPGATIHTNLTATPHLHNAARLSSEQQGRYSEGAMTVREPPIRRHVFAPMFLYEDSAPATPGCIKVMRIGIQITSILLKHDALHPPTWASRKQGFGGHNECDLLE